MNYIKNVIKHTILTFLHREFTCHGVEKNFPFATFFEGTFNIYRQMSTLH